MTRPEQVGDKQQQESVGMMACPWGEDTVVSFFGSSSCRGIAVVLFFFWMLLVAVGQLDGCDVAGADDETLGVRGGKGTSCCWRGCITASFLQLLVVLVGGCLFLNL